MSPSLVHSFLKKKKNIDEMKNKKNYKNLDKAKPGHNIIKRIELSHLKDFEICLGHDESDHDT